MRTSRLIACIVGLCALTACTSRVQPTLYPTITPGQGQPTKTSVKPMEMTVTPTVAGTIVPNAVGSHTLTSILNVSFINPLEGWVLGAACEGQPGACSAWPLVLRRTHDGGRTWEPVTAPAAEAPFSAPSLSDRTGAVLFTSELNGWLYGPDALFTRDGGTTWYRPGFGLRAMAYTDGMLWAIQQVNRSDWRIASSRDEGATWNTPIDQPAWKGSPVQLMAHGSQHLWVLANDVKGWYLWWTLDGGQTWKELKTVETNHVMRILAVEPEGTLWMLCADQPAGQSQGKSLYRSDDHGTTWQLIAVPPFDSRLPCSLPWEGQVLEAGQYIITSQGRHFLALQRHTLMRSDGDPCAWSQAIPLELANMGDATVSSVTFVDSIHGWAPANPNRLFITLDGGLTWILVVIS